MPHFDHFSHPGEIDTYEINVYMPPKYSQSKEKMPNIDTFNALGEPMTTILTTIYCCDLFGRATPDIQKMCPNQYKEMPMICPNYVRDMRKICLEMPKISPKYAQDITQNIQKIFIKHTQDMPIYAQDMPKICSRFTQDMPEICPRYPQYMPKIWIQGI